MADGEVQSPSVATASTATAVTPAAPAAAPVSTPNTPPKLPAERGAVLDAQRATLEGTVADKLKKIDWGDRDAETPAEAPAAEVKETPIEETPAETVVAEGEEVPPLKEIEEVQEGETKDQQPKADPAAGPTVPDAYRRSLKAYDWTDEEINAAAAQNPAQFLVTAQRIHSNRSSEIARWADIGRQVNHRQQENQPQQPSQQHTDPKTGLFKPIDVTALAEKYGNPELVNEMAGPVNAMIQQFNAVLPMVLGGVSSIEQSRKETLSRQVEQFFTQKELEPFTKVYGKIESMDNEQVAARNKVLETADALIAGAAQQSRKLSITDALTMAHDHVSVGFKREAVRQEIKGAVQKRSTSLTVKPAKNAVQPSGIPKSSQEMESRTRSRLAAVFGG